jgi:MSHA biogenesis protein MshL
MKLKLSVIAVASTLLLSACVTSDFSKGTANQKVQSRTAEAINAFKTQEAKVGEVNELNERFISFKPVKMARPEGTVSLRAAGAPVGPSIADVARQAGYSLVFSDAVDATRKVTAEFNKAEPEDVIRNLAFLAGYVAIFDRDNKTITIAQTATYTYKLPPAMFQQLGSNYTIGGNPVTQGGGGGSGGSSGASSGSGSGGGGMQASFIITGRESTNSKGVEKMITDIAGKNAEVTVSDMGLITVRSNAQSLKRVTSFFQNLAKDALTQVEIEASIIEVTLSDEFQFGLDWKRVLGAKLFGSDTNIALDFSPTNILKSTMQATFTTANITTVISSLRKLTDARIISQPRILAVNNTPSSFFDGTQLPYLGTLTATTTGTTGGTQLSGTTSQAVDGISFSVQPSVIDDTHVQITLLPVLSTVTGFETFDLGTSGKLTSPKQSTKQTFMKVMAESGKTLILGGIRYTVNNKNTSAGPVPVLIQGRESSGIAKEVVILLRATVLPAPPYNPIVSESV